MSSGFGANILVTGADRGIGYGLVQAFAKRDEVKNIFAACYDPEQAEHFHQKVIVIKMDVENDKSIDIAYDETVKLLGNEPLNLLINNAGIGGRKGTAYDNAERDAFQKVFNVNATAPAMVTKKFLPLIEKADKEGQRAMVINMGSYGGSINIGYMVRVNIVYGMSKAALHFYTQLMSKFMADTGIIFVAIHPGSVKTQLCRSDALITVEECVEDMLKTIAKFTKNESGKLINRFGEELPF